MPSRVVLGAIALLVALPTAARAAPSPEQEAADRIRQLLRGPLRHGTTSIFVADAATGERLFAIDPDHLLNPASNVKLIATAAALDILGAEYRYPTRVLGEVTDDSGVVTSDLYLLGSHDPTLSVDGLRDLARQLAERGIRRFTGDVVVGDLPGRDGVPRAAVELTIAAASPGEPPAVAVAEPARDVVEVVVSATTATTRRTRGLRAEAAWAIGDDGRRRLRITVAGQIGRGRTLSRTVPIRERARFAAHLLRRALADAGVEVTGDVHVTALRDYLDASLARGFIPLPLAEHRSPPLSQLIQQINKQSSNWLADRVIMTAAARRYGGAPTMPKAVDAMYAWLSRRVGLGRDDVVIDTGSGLSHRTQLSARQLVGVLRAALGLGDDEPARLARLARRRAAFRASLAVGGEDGTIRRRFEDLDGRVLGKTGTLRQVIALSGLLEVADDRRVVFSIISNGHAASRRARVRRAHEELVGVLAEYLHHVDGGGP